tara:strand:+ start:412 stop:696 length:285 start_codon:yes stop_codon:yes gene_type:complete
LTKIVIENHAQREAETKLSSDELVAVNCIKEFAPYAGKTVGIQNLLFALGANAPRQALLSGINLLANRGYLELPNGLKSTEIRLTEQGHRNLFQ